MFSQISRGSFISARENGFREGRIKLDEIYHLLYAFYTLSKHHAGFWRAVIFEIPPPTFSIQYTLTSRCTNGETQLFHKYFFLAPFFLPGPVESKEQNS